MSYFLKRGNTFQVTSKEALDLHEKLPAGNYVIKEDPMTGLYLEEIAHFSFKGKQYGNLPIQRDRIIETFKDRSGATGVMLTGEKGSGKSLLAKLVCIKAMQDGIPTIVINSPWVGDKFNAFLQNIVQPCAILFDEFEKVYDKDDQEQILTLLDGVFPSKKLFILTCNDKWRIDSHMRNRPGRIYYMLDFKGLEQDFVTEYCTDNLKNMTHSDRICQISSLFGEFNFDMLKAMVEEMNRYDEAPETVLKMLNVKPEFDQGKDTAFSVTLTIGETPIDTINLNTKEWKGNPLLTPILVEYECVIKKKTGLEYRNTHFTTTDLKKIDSDKGTYAFVNKNGDRLVLTRIVKSYFDVYNAL